MHLAEVLEPGHYWSLPVSCGGLSLLDYIKWPASRSDSRSHIDIKKKTFCHPTRSAQCDKNPRHSPMLCSRKVRKPRWTGSPVTVGSLHFPRSPSGAFIGIQVRSCQRQVWELSGGVLSLVSLFFTLWSSSHQVAQVHPELLVARAAKEAKFKKSTLQLMQMCLNHYFNPFKHVSCVTPMKSYFSFVCIPENQKLLVII